MDLQADIKWMQRELQEVKDPTFLEAIKNMLKYRREVKVGLSEEQKREAILMEEAEADIKAGRVYSIDEARKIINNWEL